MRVATLVCMVLLVGLRFVPTPLLARTSLEFFQLDWNNSMGITQPDSSWGQVTLDFTGSPRLQFFNLNVGGDWVIENLDVASILGIGVQQTVATYFDLGVENGIDVASLEFISTIDPFPRPSMPTGTLTTADVADLPFAMGGLGNGVLEELEPPAQGGGGHGGGGRQARLPKIGEFLQDHNQPLGRNDCVRGSVSNSLRYLQFRRRIPSNVPSSIDDIAKMFGDGGSPNPSPSEWVDKKKKTQPYKRQLRTSTVDVQREGDRRFFTDDQITRIFNAIKRGHDVELQGRMRPQDAGPVSGHVMWVVGIRQDKDGKITLDVVDDNQREEGADGIKTYRMQTLPGQFAGQQFVVLPESRLVVDRFVIEEPPPRRRPKKRRNSSNGRSQGNGMSFDPLGGSLSFGENFIVDTGYADDLLVGAEVVVPEFILTEEELTGSVLFDRGPDDPLTLRDGADIYFEAFISHLTYNIDDNLFHGTLFDVSLGGADLNSPFFNPDLTPIASPFLQELEDLLDPDSPNHDPESDFYFTFSPFSDVSLMTSELTEFASLSGENAMFLGYAVPEPSSGVIATGLVLIVMRLRRRPQLSRTHR